MKKKALSLLASATGVMMHAMAYAQTTGQWTQSGQDVSGFSENIMNIVMYAVIAVFFLGGAVLAGMGIFAAVNKDSNPQGAHGAWKKIAGGAALIAFTVILGLLRNTILRAGS